MKILLTGVTGYIGKRLVPFLLQMGYSIVCCVRDKKRYSIDEEYANKIEVVEVDFLKPETLKIIPKNIDVAYYFIHSMTGSISRFEEAEKICAENFRDIINTTNAEQVIYLSGIVNENELSRHLQSRKTVEEILAAGRFHLTTLRAGIILGSGSASFEIMRDLVEKLPVMVAPKWVNTKSQPISVRNVIEYLVRIIKLEEAYDMSFDIGGPEVLTYKEMLLRFAKIRNLHRFVLNIPVLTPKLSSYWLYFVTAVNYKLASNLVDSLKVEVIIKNDAIQKIIKLDLLSFEEAVKAAFDKIEQNEVVSSWTDALSKKHMDHGIDKYLNVPSFGCLKDQKKIKTDDENLSIKNIMSIGGENGWYYANWLWEIRGFIDKLFGGVGLRRGRKNKSHISAGETLDFWRVIHSSESDKRLLLYAEMKLPGEAWLEFSIKDNYIYQTATFRPKGLLGRFYWYLLVPIHKIIFKGMIKKIAGMYKSK